MGVQLRAIVVFMSLLVTSGCTAAEYLAQAGCGQIDIMLRARDIDAVVADVTVPKRTRELLAGVRDIKKFGERHSLRPTGSYHRYVELPRPVVVWVVTASEPLRFRPATWWFPIVGRVPYLGWFDREAAYDFAAQLRAQGLDVDVGGAEAYSTLGWFDDPVLSTMLDDGPEAVGELADVVLHESVHATLYIDGQTRFNESLAVFVAGRLTLAYLDERYGPASEQKTAFVEAERSADERREQMRRAYQALEALYASSRPAEEKLAAKRRILIALQREVHRRRPINNATLSAFKSYHSGAPELEALIVACGGSWQRFFEVLAPLKKNRAPFVAAGPGGFERVIMSLVKAGCRV